MASSRGVAILMFVGSVAVPVSSSIDSIVTGEELSLRRFGTPVPSSDAGIGDEAPAPALQRGGPVAGVVVEEFASFGTGGGPGLPDFGFGAEADRVVTEELAAFAAEDGKLSDEHFATAPLRGFGAGEGPGLPAESAEIITAPRLRSAGAGISAPIVTVASTELKSFGAHEEPASCLQLAWAEIARAWMDLNRAARDAAAPRHGAAMGAFRRFQTAEPAFTLFLILGLLAMFSRAAKMVGSVCSRSPQKKAYVDDPLGYAFAARSIEVRSATSVAWLPCTIRS